MKVHSHSGYTMIPSLPYQPLLPASTLVTTCINGGELWVGRDGQVWYSMDRMVWQDSVSDHIPVPLLHTYTPLPPIGYPSIPIYPSIRDTISSSTNISYIQRGVQVVLGVQWGGYKGIHVLLVSTSTSNTLYIPTGPLPTIPSILGVHLYIVLQLPGQGQEYSRVTSRDRYDTMMLIDSIGQVYPYHPTGISYIPSSP